jgi:hypothetical protein
LQPPLRIAAHVRNSSFSDLGREYRAKPVSGRTSATTVADCPGVIPSSWSTGLQLFGAGDNVKPIVIGTVIVLAVVLDAYRDRFLKAIESR